MIQNVANNMEINIDGVRKFDLQNVTDAIDYLCYITEDKYNLVNLTLYHSPDKRLLADFRDDFTHEKRKLYRYILCYNCCRDFNDTFLDSANKFIFNDYFLNNFKSTDVEKKSRLGLILNNINNLMKEILVVTQRINFAITSNEQTQNIEKEFENKFQSKLYVCYDYNSNPLKISAYPLCLLWFCLGIGLKKTYDKLIVEYSGYVDSTLINQGLLNPSFPVLANGKKIADRNDILQTLFKNDFKSLEKFIKFEDKLITYQYLNADKSNWIKGTSEFIRFYMHCEKNVLRKGVYEKNSRGVRYFRSLYDYHDGKAIDVPSKRKKQLTTSTKHEFDFLDI